MPIGNGPKSEDQPWLIKARKKQMELHSNHWTAIFTFLISHYRHPCMSRFSESTSLSSENTFASQFLSFSFSKASMPAFTRGMRYFVQPAFWFNSPIGVLKIYNNEPITNTILGAERKIR